jgi:hypothetical protein
LEASLIPAKLPTNAEKGLPPMNLIKRTIFALVGLASLALAIGASWKPN